jgi:hypothetical protein
MCFWSISGTSVRKFDLQFSSVGKGVSIEGKISSGATLGQLDHTFENFFYRLQVLLWRNSTTFVVVLIPLLWQTVGSLWMTPLQWKLN